MAVDTRKAEILKLHDRAAEKSEALRVAENMISKSAQKFDEFLRSSDAAAHEAIHKADEAARVAQEKAAAVQQLRQKLESAKARAASNSEKVEEYSRYRAFLEHITPHDWLKDQEGKSRESVQKLKQQWVQAQLQQQQLQYATDLEGIDSELKEKLKELEKKPRDSKANAALRKDMEEKAEKRKRQLTGKLKSVAELEELFESEKLALTGSHLYFQDPQEPLRLFRELEEENLFLIQTAHEHAIVRVTRRSTQYLKELEAMEKRFAGTRAEMNARLEGLEAVITELQEQLKQQHRTCKQYREVLALQEQESDVFVSLQKLTAHVAAIHAACNFDTLCSDLVCCPVQSEEGSVDCLRMLEQIEARLDSHLAALAKHEVGSPPGKGQGKATTRESPSRKVSSTAFKE
ncbi:cilia- and flagella-associated protein 100 [Cyclospora cayetanensis]|uniref:Cilia- and flagella-associated protein 100 n=1 Tax=Cyclospora cayetanensis TaxID=88456 RepID=A0A6P6RXC4_9EIME|nr:cilia- and flagella-associated protein 100 [Cyclospora cayetanensis]